MLINGGVFSSWLTKVTFVIRIPFIFICFGLKIKPNAVLKFFIEMFDKNTLVKVNTNMYLFSESIFSNPYSSINKFWI